MQGGCQEGSGIIFGHVDSVPGFKDESWVADCQERLKGEEEGVREDGGVCVRRARQGGGFMQARKAGLVVSESVEMGRKRDEAYRMSGRMSIRACSFVKEWVCWWSCISKQAIE